MFSAAYCFSQDPKKNDPPDIKIENPDDEVLKINTDLIQTGVTVLDKKGQFVDQLKQDDFELRVDGKPVPISFFERVIGESNQTASGAKQNNEKTAAANGSPPARPNMPGRTVIFVVDDLHLSLSSHRQTRDLITKFIDREMIYDDLVAIISTSGQIGFLQQFTSDRTVLRMAVERLTYNNNRSMADRTSPPMTEYEAMLIERGDEDVTNIFVQLLLKEMPGTRPDVLRSMVRARANAINSQVSTVNRGTYSALEQAVRNSHQLAGRKIVFFISDGFLLDSGNSDATYRLRRITDAAARTNTVIYSFDAKGLEAGLPEGTSATGNPPSTGYRVQSGERLEGQDGLNALADSTGGKFIRNTNDLKTGMTGAIKEVSTYYLLAWEPVSENDKSDRLRKIEVVVKDRPDLQVRMQTGYLSEAFKAAKEQNQSKDKPNKSDKPVSVIDADLTRALVKPLPLQTLPVALVANYVDMGADGAMLATSVEIKNDESEFALEAEKASAKINLLGIIYNSEGKREGFFNELLTVNTMASELKKKEVPPIFYNHQLKLKPGLYQVRIAARGDKTARVGSALQWIFIPDLSSSKLALSSLFVGEQSATAKSGDAEPVDVATVLKGGISVNRRFARSSKLRCLVFVYNALRGKTESVAPEVFLQTSVWRGNEVVMTSGLSPLSVKGTNSNRIPYVIEIPLNSLPVGRYELQITVQEDRNSKSPTEQRIKFEVK